MFDIAISQKKRIWRNLLCS